MLKSVKMSTNVEKTHVLDVYDKISTEFSNSRYAVWNFVSNFFEGKESLLGLDIGCGNGKNMIYENMIGMDTNTNFVNICSLNGKQVIKGDLIKLPFKDESFDYTICISALHHLSTYTRRFMAMIEMIRVLKVGGNGIMNVWSVENQDKRTFVDGDNLVPWVSRNKIDIFHRYYHVMNQISFDTFIRQFNDYIHITKVYNEKGNWIVEFEKK